MTSQRWPIVAGCEPSVRFLMTQLWQQVDAANDVNDANELSLIKTRKKNRQKSTATVSVVVCCCCCYASAKLRPLMVETTDAFNPERHPTPPRSNTDRDLPQRVSSCSSAFCPRGSEQSAEGGFYKSIAATRSDIDI